jgi:hypothetical protein
MAGEAAMQPCNDVLGIAAARVKAGRTEAVRAGGGRIMTWPRSSTSAP